MAWYWGTGGRLDFTFAYRYHIHLTILLMAQGPRRTGFVSSSCEWFHLNPILSLLPSQFTAYAYSLRLSASSSFWLVRVSMTCVAAWRLSTSAGSIPRSSIHHIGFSFFLFFYLICCMKILFFSGVIGGCTYNGRNCFSDYNDCYQVRCLGKWSVSQTITIMRTYEVMISYGAPAECIGQSTNKMSSQMSSTNKFSLASCEALMVMHL